MTSSRGLSTRAPLGNRCEPVLNFCPHAWSVPIFALLLCLLNAPDLSASSRWASALMDTREAAMSLAGTALDQGSDPAQWAALEELRLEATQITGPSEALGNGVSLAGPLVPWLSFGLQAGQQRGAEAFAEGRAPQAYRDARLRLGLAHALALEDKHRSFAFGFALSYYDHGAGAVRRAGAGVDLGARGTVVDGLVAGLAFRDLKIPNSYADELPGEGVLGLGYQFSKFSFAADLALPLPSASRGPAMARLGAAYAPTPWCQLLLGCASSEVAGQGGQVSFGGSLRQGPLEMNLCAMQRPQPERSSLHASLAWHFQPPEAPPRPVRAYRRPPLATPEPTPEPETGSFDLQVGYRDGQIFVAWPDGPEAEGGYDLLMGLVPGATMKKVNDEPLKARRWSGSPGMAGMTYYFRVRALDKAGAEASRSRLSSLQVPVRETP